MDNVIEGKNAVTEALRASRQIEKILVAKETADALGKITALAKEKRVTVQIVPRVKIDEITETKNHQGVAAIAAAHEYVELDDILDAAEKKGEQPFIIILDHITDPYNLGAIIRTAEAAGAHGVVIPKRRAASVTGIAEKAAAGAASHIGIAKVTNIASCIDELKKKGVWVYCACEKGTPVFSQDFSGAMAIVIGAEGEGVSKLVHEKCDFFVTIPMYGNITSLNASVAAGIVIYEAVRQREK